MVLRLGNFKMPVVASHFGLKVAAIANRNGRNMVQHVLLSVNIHFQ
jgi:hypothetical protein